MENPNKSVYPQIGSVSNNENQLTEVFSDENNSGLSKREYAAIAAMQGILSNPSLIDYGHNNNVMIWISEHSVQQADKLLKQLEITK